MAGRLTPFALSVPQNAQPDTWELEGPHFASTHRCFPHPLGTHQDLDRDVGEGEQVEEQEMTADHVNTAMNAVAQMVFPHRALETQKLWMNRCMVKPRHLSTRSTSAAISQINNALPHFPGATENDKFSEVTLVGMLEWSLPAMCQEQFDLKGYIPTQHN